MFVKEKIVQTRKKHRCFGCAKTFPEKTILLSQVFADNDEGIRRNYFCQDCWHEFNSSWIECETDMLTPGEIGFWKNGKWHPMIED